MPTTVRVSTRGFRTKLRGMSRRAEDVSPAWSRVGNLIARNNRRQFSTQGKHYGTPWPKLKAETRKQKAREGYPRQILVRSGELRRQFTGRPMAVEQYHNNNAVYGSDSDLAKWHQFGTKRDGKRVNPPRPMLKWTRELRKDASVIVLSYIVGKPKKKKQAPKG